MNVPTSHRWSDRLRTATTVLTYLLVLLAVAFCWSRDDADPDLWGHVRFGLDRIAYGLPTGTTYSYTAGNTWINHELGAEWIFAVIAKEAGSFGLLALKLAIGIAVAACWLKRHHRDAVTPGISFAAVLLGAWGLAHFWSVRPQIFSFLYFTLLLLLLGHAFFGWEGNLSWPWPRPKPRADDAMTSPYPYDSRRMRTLWLAPVLFALWANTHGAFVAGLAVYIVYLAGRMVEAWWLRGPYALGHARRFTLMAEAAAFATALQPYGLKLHWWLWNSLRTPRPEITEWHPPDLASASGLALVAALSLFAITALFSKRPRDLVQWILLSILACMALTHERHTPFFLIAWVLWIPPHLQSCWESLASRFPSKKREEVKPQWGLALLLFGVITLSLALWPKLGPIRVEKSRYPVGAVEYLAKHGWNGRIVVTYNWAQYVLASVGASNSFCSGLMLAFDGRFRTAYPQEQVDAHFDFLLGDVPALRWRSPKSPPFDPTRTLRDGHPALVLVERHPSRASRIMAEQPEFILLYRDGLAEVWGRFNRFGDPASPDYVPPEERPITDARPEGWVAWPALPVRHDRPAYQIGMTFGSSAAKSALP